jgi:probable HAF family extracellular repeat protein
MQSRQLTCVTAVVLLALVLPFRLPAQQTRYTVSFLGTLGGCCSVPFGINNNGAVEGNSTLPGDQNFHGFFWRDGVITDIGTLGGPNSNGDFGAPYGPNERGQLVGNAFTSIPDPFGEDFCFSGANLICAPFVWQKGVMTPLPTLGGYNGVAGDINNRGQIIGLAENAVPDTDCPGTRQSKPVLWEKGNIQELPTFPGDPDGQGIAINDLGQAVGISGIACIQAAFAAHGLLWQNGTWVDLGNLGGGTFNFPQNINNQGQVVGSSDLPGDTFPGHAFLWTQDSGIQNLGTLPGDVSSGAKDVNDKGQVVGQSCDANMNCRAFLWQNGVMTDLNAVVPGGGSTFFMIEAVGINSRGQIAVTAFDANTGDCCAFLATPLNSQSLDTTASNSVSEKPKIVIPTNVRKMLDHWRAQRYHTPGLGVPNY